MINFFLAIAAADAMSVVIIAALVICSGGIPEMDDCGRIVRDAPR